MARVGQQVVGLDEDRLPGRMAVGVLTRVFPPHVVDGVLAECGRVERRHRLLPARAVVYYVMGLALFSGSSYEEVMRMLVAGHSWSQGWSQPWAVPSKVALSKARSRLGSEPLQALFDRVAVPMATASTRGAFYRSVATRSGARSPSQGEVRGKTSGKVRR